MSDAKDEEIHRLRGWLDRVLYKTGCTRGQRTTQWCDEAVEAHRELREAQAEIERLKSDLHRAIQALHCSAPNEWMSVEEIRAWLEIRNTLSDKYKEAT